MTLRPVPARPTLRVYLRRSKGDDHQTYSLDIQRAGSDGFAAALGFDFEARAEYLDDDRAGDDFTGRVGLQRLLRDTRPGDVIVMRDQSRLGRDAIEVTAAIRDLVRERGASLHYYSSGQRVEMRNAYDQAMAFIQGTSHQAELENIRQRTAEALRARVKSGRVAGGRCYGYRNVQSPDPDGRRKNTVAVIDEDQAEVVRRIFRLYASGRGLGAIAKELNRAGILSPAAGKRGTGSWSPSAVRSILHNERYRGVHAHGRKIRERKGGKRVVKPGTDIIRIERPEWRVVDEELWKAVAARFANQSGKTWRAGAAVYPLTGIAKCAECGGAISISNTKISGGVRVQAYSCSYHVRRGDEVCSVKIRQPRDEVEQAVATHLTNEVLTPDLVRDITTRVLELAGSDSPSADLEHLEHELAQLRAEQKRAAKLLVALDDAPEVEAEYRKRQTRIRELESDLAMAKAAPLAVQMTAEALAGAVGAVLGDLREGLLAAPASARDAIRAMFPRGLLFAPDQKGTRWEITGSPVISLGGCTSLSDPTEESRLVRLPPIRIITRLAA